MSDTSSVSLDDVVVSRTDDGLIVPEETYVEELEGMVEARPLNKAGKEKYIQPLAESLQIAHALSEGEIDPDELDDEDREQIEERTGDALSSEMLAEMFNEHIAKPDLVAAYNKNLNDDEEEVEEIDARFVDEELIAGVEDGLFFAILQVSDMEDLAEAMRGNVEQEDEEGNAEGS